MPIEQYRPSGFKLMPEVVKNLLIINGIFFLATILLQNQGIDLIDKLGLHYFPSEKFKPYQLITYMFMHGGFAHILFNMFALWMFGQAIENIWGGRKFLFYYIFCGLGAAVTHYAVVYFTLQPAIDALNNYMSQPVHSVNDLSNLLHSELFSNIKFNESFIQNFKDLQQSDPSAAFEYSVRELTDFKRELLNAPVVVGASGAVFGLLLAYGMTFPNNLIYVYFAIPIRAKYFVILYGAIELFSGIANPTGDDVAHFAHLGGLLFGFLLILYWKNKNRRNNNFYNNY
jgi:membrane associated rhomboid family serine protease